MAIYRNISMSFWSDTKVVDNFSPEDKFFMLYCLTNTYTNLCGCYEISIKQMSRDTGYNEETIRTLLKRFTEEYKVIQYNEENKELFIKNWNKYNWTKSSKLDKPLLEDIKKIKTKEFKEQISEIYNKRDTVSIPYIYPMDTTVSVSDTDINKINNNNYNNISNNISNNNINKKETLYEVVEKNFGRTLSPLEYEEISKWKDNEITRYAIKEAVLRRALNIKYIGAIIRDCEAKGIKTIKDIRKPVTNENEAKNDELLYDYNWLEDE